MEAPGAKDGTDGVADQADHEVRAEPQGQQLIERAKVEASKPENCRKLEELRRRYLDKDKRR